MHMKRYEEKDGRKWLTVWAQAHTDMTFMAGAVRDNTSRLTIVNRIGGNAVRVRFSNQVGTKEAEIAAASVSFASQKPVELRFGGRTGISLAPGESAYSDAVEMELSEGERLSVSVAIQGKATSGNHMAEHVRYSPRGNFTMEAVMPEMEGMEKEIKKMEPGRHGPFMPLLSRIEVCSRAEKDIILCFGDSITQQCQWTKPLAEFCARSAQDTVILNLGIDGNKLLTDPMAKLFAMFGEAGIRRFQRDILEVPGGTTVIFALGTNDIGMARSRRKLQDNGADAIMKGFRELCAHARQAGMRVYLATVTPRGGSGAYKKMHEEERILLNGQIRESTDFDGILDFEEAVRDEKDPYRIKPEYDSGDHLHPGPEGGKAIAKTIEKMLFFQASSADKL